MGENGSQAGGMTWGDPLKMSEEQRRAGYEGLKRGMHAQESSLAEASGTVSDNRRLVAFVYLVLRDNMLAGTFAEVMRTYRTGVPPSMFRRAIGYDKHALRLSDKVPLPVMREWITHLFHQSSNEKGLEDLLWNMVPAHDDTETVFTNGWLALYAKHVADELEAHACTQA